METYRNLSNLEPFIKGLADQQPQMLVALGDSNTDNAWFTGGAKQWPELLHTRLRQHYGCLRLQLVNAGICGNTVLSLLDRLKRDVLRVQPELVILCIGSNDANRLSDADYEDGLQRVLDLIAGCGSAVLVRTPTPIWQKDKGYNRIWPDDDKLRAKVGVIRKVADARALAFIDTYALWHEMEAEGRLDMHDLMTDAVHTNAAGHRLVYRQILPAFACPVEPSAGQPGEGAGGAGS